MKDLLIKTYYSNFDVFYKDYYVSLSFDMFRNECDEPCYESEARETLSDYYECPPEIIDEVIRDMYTYEWIREDVTATMDRIQAYAEAHSLRLVYTTFSAPALVGFDNFREADEAAKALGYDADWDIYDIYKKNGERYYRENGHVYEAYDITADMYGCDYEMYRREEAEQYLANELDIANEILIYEEDEEAALAHEAASRANAKKIASIPVGHAALMVGNEIVDIVERHPMSYYIDGKEHYIAVVCDGVEA